MPAKSSCRHTVDVLELVLVKLVDGKLDASVGPLDVVLSTGVDDDASTDELVGETCSFVSSSMPVVVEIRSNVELRNPLLADDDVLASFVADEVVAVELAALAVVVCVVTVRVDVPEDIDVVNVDEAMVLLEGNTETAEYVVDASDEVVECEVDVDCLDVVIALLGRKQNADSKSVASCQCSICRHD